MANTVDKAKKQVRLKEFIGKTKESVIKHIDVNDDGAFDKKDVSDTVCKVINGTKSKVDGIKANMEKRKDNPDLKYLNPVFSSDLKEIKRNLPRLICITEKIKDMKKVKSVMVL